MSARSLRQLAFRTTALVAVSATVALAAGCGSGSDSSKGTTKDVSAQTIPGTVGKEIFVNAGCVSCHTLAAAGGEGNIGPNLDKAKPSKAEVVAKVSNGDGRMPSFKGKLTTEQINTVAEYVSSVAGTK